MDDLNKLKVNELRQELDIRGLDTKGLKSILIDRLKNAMDSEKKSASNENGEYVVAQREPFDEEVEGQDELSDSELSSKKQTVAEIIEDQARSPKDILTPQKSDTSEEMVTLSPEKTETPPKVELLKTMESPQKTETLPKEDTPKILESTQKTETSPEVEILKTMESPQKTETLPKEDTPKIMESPQKTETVAIEDTHKIMESPQKTETLPIVDTNKIMESPQKMEIPQKVEIPKIMGSPQKMETPQKVEIPKIMGSPQKMETLPIESPRIMESPLKTETPQKAEISQIMGSPQKTETSKQIESPAKDISTNSVSPKKDEVVPDQSMEANNIYPEDNSENVDQPANGVLDSSNNGQNYEKMETSEVKEESKTKRDLEDKSRRGEKRSRSPVNDCGKRQRSDIEEVRLENEPQFDKSLVVLDWYSSDLSLVIEPNRLEASPMHKEGFGYMWHSAKATYGVDKGKVCYEMKIIDNLDASHLEGEEHPHVVRVGWSFDLAGLILGEEKFSWGFGGTGKASTQSNFKSYGKAFGKGDVIGCYLDMESDPSIISYTINGENFGTCFELPREEIQDASIFPHIMTKNCSFKINFGDEEPSFELLEGYEYIGKLPIEDRVLAVQGPEKKEEAEVIMMIGLPASGKTTWAENYAKEHPHKKFNILGTNNLINRMKVLGLPRRCNYAGRWTLLIEKCTKALNKLLYIAYKRRRNYIIDQTNVYPSAQRRKMQGFQRFQRRAVVICPTDEELKKRSEKRDSEEGKDVPKRAVLEMKGNYKFPKTDETFDNVDFVELNREEGELLIQKYNKEGEAAGYGPKKNRRSGDRRGYNRGAGGGGGSGYRGNWDRNRDRKSNFDNRRDRDNRDHRSGGGGGVGNYNRDNRSGGGPGNYNRDNRSGGGAGNYNRDNRSGGGAGNYDRDSRSGGGYRDRNSNNNRDRQNRNSSGSVSQTDGGYRNQNQNSSGGYNKGGWNQQQQGGWNQQQQGEAQGGWNQHTQGRNQGWNESSSVTRQDYGSRSSSLTGQGYGSGSSSATGQGYGSGSSSATGQGYVSGSTSATGQAYGSGSSSATGQGYGSGSSSATGQGYGSGSSSATGQGYGSGSSSATGQGYGSGSTSATGQGYGSGSSSATGQAYGSGSSSATGQAYGGGYNWNQQYYGQQQQSQSTNQQSTQQPQQYWTNQGYGSAQSGYNTVGAYGTTTNYGTSGGYNYNQQPAAATQHQPQTQQWGSYGTNYNPNYSSNQSGGYNRNK